MDTTATPAEDNGAVSVAAPEVEATTKVKGGKKGADPIFAIAQEVEGLSKTKALNMADSLVTEVEASYFKLGGVLKVISDNSWFEGYESFGAYCQEKFGFAERKGRYLIQIYSDLVTKAIPGDKVLHLGWTKLKMLSPVLTLENLDEWVAKAEKLSVSELAALLKQPEGEGETTAKATDEIVKVPLKFHPDQFSVYQQGVAKAKGELQTEYDAVAVSAVMAGYLGGTTSIGATADGEGGFDEIVKAMGFKAALTRIGDLFPEWHIDASPVEATA